TTCGACPGTSVYTMTCTSDRSGWASSGVFITAYTPAAITATVMTSTRTTLRTDHSMIRPSMSVLPVRIFSRHLVSGVWIPGGRCVAVVRVTGRRPESLQRRLEVAFGIDEEVRGHHHVLAFGQAVQDFHAVAGAAPDGDLARGEAAGGGLDQHGRACSAIQHRRAGDAQHRLSRGLFQPHRAE